LIGYRAAAAAAGVLIALTAPATARADDEPLYPLVDAATQRLLTADPVAASKWLGGGPITDPARVQQVLAAVVVDAKSSGLPTDYATRVFTDQINATEAIQYNRFSWWKLDPAAAPVSAPDLSASRSLIDGLNRRMVAEMAGEWTLLRSPDCTLRLDAAKSAVEVDRGLDPLYRQALDAATRSYCG
jgi:chorismate mutase